MADELRVNPGQLRRGSDHVFGAMRDAAVSFAGCEDDLAGAAPGWIGASGQALTQLAASWGDQHAAYQSWLTSLGQNMTEAANAYATADGESGDVDL
jgi:uncharacterized protein YukE